MSRRTRNLLTLLLLTALGAGYGFVSSVQNRNPHYEPGAVPAPPGAAWGWRPSPVWAPSYLLCVVPRNGYGIHRSRSGYLFRDAAGRRQYAVGSTAVGGAMGLLVAAGCLCVPYLTGRFSA